MVFTWVSTGIVEPFIPKPPWEYRVPPTHSNQSTKDMNNESAPFHIPDSDIHWSRPKTMYQKVRAYQDSNQIHKHGDVLKFVYEIMTEDVDCLNETDSLEEAKRKFRQKRYRHIPILNHHKKLSGIFSDRDILRLIADEIPMASLIRNYMVTKVLTVSPDTYIRESAFVMVSEKIGCLPVLNRENELEGILTRSDILKSVTRKPPLELFA